MLLILTALSIKQVYGLNSQTAQVINGTGPYLTFDNGKTVSTTILPLLSLTLPDNKVISALEDKSSVVEPIVIEKVPTTFNDIKTHLPFNNYPSMPLANAIVANNYWRDPDGDKLFTITGSMRVKWETYDGEDVTDYVKSNPNSELDACKSPYKLTLSADDGALATRYGIPDIGQFTGASHSYYILSKREVCYLKPNATIVLPAKQWLTNNQKGDFNFDSDSDNWWNIPDSTKPDPLNGGGYTSDYVPNLGFKAAPSVSSNKFPSTGFPGAQFQLILTGAQTDYNYSVPNNPGGKVSIDKLGNVLLSDKPSGPVTVRATLKNNPLLKYDYTFDPRGIWVVPYEFAYNWQNASNFCSLITRKELTNSPRSAAPMNWIYQYSAYTRSIGESILGEWGHLDKNTYPKSHWLDQLFWTADYWGTLSGGNSAHFRIGLYYGDVGVGVDTNMHYVLCKE
ncbi:hypothetical protein A9G03_06560 [Gilliamella sp. wkB171]|nr:hypothetical protein A9G03_06560 [Gilliamella apicola]